MFFSVAAGRRQFCHQTHTVHVPANPRQQRLRLVYGRLSLGGPNDVQKPLRFCRAKFLRNHSGSGLNHVLGRLYCCIGTFAEVHNFEHGEGMFGDRVIVRIGSHGS